MNYARRNKVFFPSNRKCYKKARWKKAYQREVDRVKNLFFARAFGF